MQQNVQLEKGKEEFLREFIGWKKHNNADVEYETNGYKTDIDELNYDEAVLVHDVIEAFRKNSDKFDSALLEEILTEYCEIKTIRLNEEQKPKLLHYMEMEIKGNSILDLLLSDEALEEIALIGVEKPIYVYHREKGWMQTDLIFVNNKKIIDIINKISRSLGRRITFQRPRINSNLKFGRLHAAINPISVSGTSLTIRKFNRIPFNTFDLVKTGTISAEALAFLQLAVECDVNLIIAGNTGSGKTTTLNVLSSFIPSDERVIVIEETPEISLQHKHQVRLNVCENVEIKMHELVTDTLRMRPDRIIVGEVRAPEEVKALINTMLAGQGKSSFSTFHAQNAYEAMIRMKSFGVNALDLHALDLIVVQRRWTNNKLRKDLRRIVEICAVEKSYSTNGRELPKLKTLYKYDVKKDCLCSKEVLENSVSEKIKVAFGFNKKDLQHEIKKREKKWEQNEF